MSLSAILVSIAPIFAIIVLGHLLRRNRIPNLEFWNLNDRLVYWVLMPALLFYQTSTLEISFDLLGAYATVILGGFAAALAFGLFSARLAGYEPPKASSIMQGAARHNTFIALSIAGKVFGEDGLALAALGTSLLIPTTNLSVVPMMTVMLSKGEGRSMTQAILRDLGRNPLLLAVGLGLAFNLSGFRDVPVLHDSARMMGNAALPVVLMCVGANLHFNEMRSAFTPLLLSILGKLAIFPLVTVALALQLGLSELETLVAVLFAAAPTASAGYTLARQMGGDAPLMAAIATIQTVIAFVTLPLTMLLVQGLFP